MVKTNLKSGSLVNQALSKDLESIRGLAAFVVLIAHVVQWFILPLTGLESGLHVVISSLAHFAVLIFFVLSGFVITMSLMINYEKNGYIDGGRYIVARLGRILPPAVFAVILAIVVGVMILGFNMHGAESFRLGSDLYVARENISFNMQNVLATSILSNGMIKGTASITTNGPLWSLSVEFWLYFVALLGALVIASVNNRDFVKNGYVALLGLTMFCMLMVFRLEMFHQYAMMWGIGSLLFLRMFSVKMKKWTNVIFTLILVAGALSVGLMWGKTYYLYDKGLVIPIKLAVLILLIWVFTLTRWVNYGKKLFGVLAGSSYTLYVIHFPILCLAFSLFHEDYIAWSGIVKGIFLCLMTLLILIVSHYLALRLENKHYWSKKIYGLGERISNMVSKRILKNE